MWLVDGEVNVWGGYCLGWLAAEAVRSWGDE